ncbi:protein LEAD-SENSITIVE 1 [Gossypium raimondii]|uniref:protein LEAD-SENSITIVE 1 n=1 Tax=Gossypium raimondii TaxID=29730 RepID=UPI00227D5305|nr:protein LEAD-SENSITIVE 1 [Gossypium raimondii]
MATGQVLNPGDHIYTECLGGSYYHHGIYVGRGLVTNPNTGKTRTITNAVIHFLGLDKEGNGLYRYEYDVSLLSFTFKTSGSCTPWSCYDPNTVIKRAYDYLRDQNFGDYNFVFNNCEHFATKCKMGKARCNQALWGTGLPGALVYNVTRRLTKDILW